VRKIVLLALLAGTGSPDPASAAPGGLPKPAKTCHHDQRWLGLQHLQAVSFYEYGRTPGSLQPSPFQWAVSTFSYYCSYDPALAWSDFTYPSRAIRIRAAATALATGFKTYDAGIGVDVNGNPVPNAWSWPREGQGHGRCHQRRWTHATPAGHVAHNVSRDDYAGIGQEIVFDSARMW